MPGAGNLGDDLISATLCRHVVARWPSVSLGVLAMGHSNPFSYPQAPGLRFFPAPRLRQWQVYRGLRHAISSFLEETDLLLIGGGGLLQDTHSPFNPYDWLSYAAKCPAKCGIWGVGLGAGPLRRLSHFYLRRMIPCFDVLQVRDQTSLDLLAGLGGRPQLSVDLAAGSSLEEMGFRKRPRANCVGCALRPWPGLRVEDIAALVAAVTTDRGSSVRLFTFEYFAPGNTSERQFHEELARRLTAKGIRTEHFCYREAPLAEFIEAFATVQRGIAMRLHANILWQKLGVPVLPIAYAPKVSSLYGRQAARETPVLSVGQIQAQTQWDPGALRFEQLDMTEVYQLPEYSSGRVRRKSPRPVLLNALWGAATLVYEGGRRIVGR